MNSSRLTTTSDVFRQELRLAGLPEYEVLEDVPEWFKAVWRFSAGQAQARAGFALVIEHGAQETVEAAYRLGGRVAVRAVLESLLKTDYVYQANLQTGDFS